MEIDFRRISGRKDSKADSLALMRKHLTLAEMIVYHLTASSVFENRYWDKVRS